MSQRNPTVGTEAKHMQTGGLVMQDTEQRRDIQRKGGKIKMAHQEKHPDCRPTGFKQEKQKTSGVNSNLHISRGYEGIIKEMNKDLGPGSSLYYNTFLCSQNLIFLRGRKGRDSLPESSILGGGGNVPL